MHSFQQSSTVGQQVLLSVRALHFIKLLCSDDSALHAGIAFQRAWRQGQPTGADVRHGRQPRACFAAAQARAAFRGEPHIMTAAVGGEAETS